RSTDCRASASRRRAKRGGARRRRDGRVGGVRLWRAPPGRRSTDCRASASRRRAKRGGARRRGDGGGVKDPGGAIIEPVVREKSYALIEENVYTFRVHPDASKPEIHDAVEAIFNVTVTKVNTLNRKGKTQRMRRSNKVGHRPDTKRALVTVAAGDRIELFESGM